MSTPSGSRRGRPNVRRFLEMKGQGEKIVVLTAYDVLFARILEEVGVDIILVGDSLANVVLGYDTTLPTTLDDMIRHAGAVRRGAPTAFIVVDMPFLSYQVSPEQALTNAGTLLKETGVQAVKLEGGDARACSVVERLVGSGIPVMGHLGLTPQSVHALGGYRVQGREAHEAERLRREAKALEAAGVFAIVLELLPAELATEISRSLEVPTIGIGAGPGCDGQVLVLPDALGLNQGFRPRFLKRYADLYGAAKGGIESYVREVRDGTYPGAEHSFSRSD